MRMKSIVFFICFLALFKYTTQSICGDSENSTFCTTNNGTSGCCPIKDGVCCSNGDYCCPKGFACDYFKTICHKDSLFIPFHLKISQINNVKCPDNESECPVATTCCKLDDDSYGCCPIPNAVCCEDHIHCCPEGYSCDTQDGRCNKGFVSMPLFKKTKSNAKTPVKCPDNESECPEDTTCCKLDDGSYGCCPIPNAVCCNDHVHCCPEGYACDTKNGRCNKGTLSLPFYTKIKSQQKKKIESHFCPDELASCPTESTCCKMTTGEYACCPLPNATCCADQQHCCPNGYTCDIKDARCIRGSDFIFSQEKVKIKFEFESVVCPDGSSFCPKDTTCCKMFDGSYGCCPLVNAVCCEDQLHCCPQGSKCNLEKGTCDNVIFDSHSQFFSKKYSRKIFETSKETTIKMSPLICPDQTTCDARATCCKQDADSFGCCPYTNGVCCPNSSFCCPENFECGSKPGECIPDKKIKNHVLKNLPILNWHRIEKKSIKRALMNVESDYQKKIKEVEKDCAEAERCLKPDGTYLCCPYKNGTCCGTHGYCCPGGDYICDDPKLETCRLPEGISYIKPIKIQASKLNEPSTRFLRFLGQRQSVKCEDTIHYCPDTYTCCTLKQNNKLYGCCPVADAVCCDDGINCCPKGYQCSNEENTICKKI